MKYSFYIKYSDLDGFKSYTFSDGSHAMSTIKNQIIAYWPNIAVGTSIIRYTNSDGAAIAYCVKQSSNYGTLSVMPIGTDRPLKGWVNAAGWKWDEYILTSDIEYFSAVVTVAAGATNTVAITYKNRYASIPVPVAVVGGTAVDPKYVNWTVRSRNATGCVIAITNTHPSTSIQPSIYGSVMAEK